MTDKIYMKPFSEYYDSSRAIVVRYSVLTLSRTGSNKIHPARETVQMKQALQVLHAISLYTQIKRHLFLLAK
jgi:hypothetical protein